MYIFCVHAAPVLSLARILGPYTFTAGFALMWDRGGANGFDVGIDSTHNIHAQYLEWEEHWLYNINPLYCFTIDEYSPI